MDLGEKEYAAGLSFVAISRVCTLKMFFFDHFHLKDFIVSKLARDYKRDLPKRNV